MTWMKLPLVILAAALFSNSAVAADQAGSTDSSQLAKGEELFGRNCQQCHNTRGKGGKGPQLIRGAWGPGGANSDEYMRKIITEGRPGTQMGAFGPSLSAEEINHIIVFLRNESKQVKASDSSSAEDDLLW